MPFDLGLPDKGASIRNFDTLMERCANLYTMVDIETAAKLLSTVDEFAIDFETTALHPRDGRIRLTSISYDDVTLLIDHDIAGDITKLIPHLRGKIMWAYNSKFEITWLDWYCEGWDYDDLLHVRDIDFLAKSVIGGYVSSLLIMAKRDLKIYMSKDQQASDWSAKSLNKEQLDYAAFDSYITWQIKKRWYVEANEAQLAAAEFVFDDAVRGTVECEQTGLGLDIEYYEGVIDLWQRKFDTFERYLRKFTPPDVIANLGSDVQIGKYLEQILPEDVLANWPRTAKKKQMQFESKYLRSISRQFGYPFNRWLAALAGFKYWKKYLSTYGETMLTKAVLSGNLTSRYNIGLAATGRYSSSKINLQNIPRKVYVRTGFKNQEADRTYALADYKGVEIRVLAELTDDTLLRGDVIYGDVHAASCGQIYGYDYEYVLEVLASEGQGKYSNIYPLIKEQRSKAKGFTFQLLYGAGPAALSDVLKCSFDDAVRAIDKWAERYTNAYDYRNTMFAEMQEFKGRLSVVDGRTIVAARDKRTQPVAANYGIQGAAASVMYRAVHHTHRNFYEADIDAYLAATVHDEMLSDTHRDCAEQAMELQIKGMTDAWLDIFPGTNTDNLTDYAIGDTWAAKP